MILSKSSQLAFQNSQKFYIASYFSYWLLAQEEHLQWDLFISKTMKDNETSLIPDFVLVIVAWLKEKNTKYK